MWKLAANIKWEGEKEMVLELKDRLTSLLQGYPGQYNISISNREGVMEEESMRVAPNVVEDVVDMVEIVDSELHKRIYEIPNVPNK